ncbi:hypothetical protein JOF53_003823 [Crossiella equi]|uniref:Uncharacterized protein n=1 Tax=Crossiella equi TaxID=130796 RepID=A0ABS5AF43_9PSEU|nr:hypothetical protein [Crossiella equi]MBP2474951.1 hypothetical protein [Crossiella equi]
MRTEHGRQGALAGRLMVAAETARSLRAWQSTDNPEAYRCPDGHGVLGLYRDRDSVSGLVLACESCPHRLPVDAQAVHRAGPPVESALPGTAETPWRGQLANGLVRTHGWLLLGGRPVSSGLLCALAGLVLPLVLLPAPRPWVLVVPMLAYLGWKVATVRLRPASRVRNPGVVPASELCEGQHVRRYGQIGPVARVESAMPWEDGLVLVCFAGGTSVHWPPSHRVHLAELYD